MTQYRSSAVSIARRTAVAMYISFDTHTEMNTDDYVLTSVRHRIWSGFYGPGDVDETIVEMAEEEGIDEDAVRRFAAEEFAAKSAAEESWPESTYCDRLDAAFEELNELGVIALANAGYTQSDGISDVSEVLAKRDRHQVKGYCFYHGQDVERAVDGGGLMFAFGDLDDNDKQKIEVGRIIKQTLEKSGFKVEWNEDPNRRLSIPKFDWKRRFDA